MSSRDIILEEKKYSRGYLFYVVEDSPVLKLNPLSKLYSLIIMSILAFLIFDHSLLFILIIITITLFFISRIPLYMIKKFILALSGMALGFFLVNTLFTHIDGEIVYIDFYVFKIPYTNYGWHIYITDATLRWAGLIFLRTMILVWISLWFLVVTRDTDIIYALRRIGLPRSAAFAFALSLRSVSMFYDDFVTVVEAMKSKGVNFSEGGLVSRLKKYGRAMFPLVLLALRRIEEFTKAIESRGFSIKCNRRILYRKYSISKLDFLFFITFTALFIIMLDLSNIIDLLSILFLWWRI